MAKSTRATTAIIERERTVLAATGSLQGIHKVDDTMSDGTHVY
jgi:hypothetical protein